MDYDANLNAACPVEIVQEVRNTDMASHASHDIRRKVQLLGGPGVAECSKAIVEYFTPLIGEDTDVSRIDMWLVGLGAHFKQLPNDFYQDAHDALVRLSYRSEVVGIHASTRLASRYFRTLVDFRIDVRDVLAKRSVGDWDGKADPRFLPPAWHYTRYLASFNTPGAYDELARRLEAQSAVGDLDRMYSMMLGLRELDTPEALTIIGKYKNDTRLYRFQDYSPVPFGNKVQTILRFGAMSKRAQY